MTKIINTFFFLMLVGFLVGVVAGIWTIRNGLTDTQFLGWAIGLLLTFVAMLASDVPKVRESISLLTVIPAMFFVGSWLTVMTTGIFVGIFM